ncbi:histidine phosphatase family protein [Halobacillus sp. A5]|uniref:histidine phosphatase family protein n=1 Tax=Halobacillus sp. A5 TaxID=2880263 RepID=UPI0020A641C9|nr:histidine phosphatase family protein [Halobacillus sp. A5]MCP3028207.1 histidine phosphatase family protein [Halobacillus sp. A5]
MRIGFIRHGSTSWNKEGRAQGHYDVPLDEYGRADTFALAQKMDSASWSCIYSSDLSRARQTAQTLVDEGVMDRLNLDRRLRELGGGQIEGTTETERVKKWGENWRELELGIEKKEEALERALDFLTDVTDQHVNESILVVSHGSFLKHLIGELTGEEIEESLGNTSLTILVLEGKKWNIEVFNDLSHLHS